MTEYDAIVIRVADWRIDTAALRKLRSAVFIEEQHVPAELEWDEYDETSVHFIVELDGTAIATARLKPDGQIGRMAVAREHRHRGVGTRLIRYLLGESEGRGIHSLYLHSQIDAIGFYERLGFTAEGDTFDDAGIPHRAMFRRCAT